MQLTFRIWRKFRKLKNLKDKEELKEMILALDSANFGADIKHVSSKNYKQIGRTFGKFKNWKTRGYSTILDVLMVITNYSVYELRDRNKYFIIF